MIHDFVQKVHANVPMIVELFVKPFETYFALKFNVTFAGRARSMA